MSKRKTYRDLKYNPSVRPISAIPIQDIRCFDKLGVSADTSTGESVTKSWIADFDMPDNWGMTYNNVFRPIEKMFMGMLLDEDFSDSNRNVTTYYVSNLRRENKIEIATWIRLLYVAYQDNEFFLMQLFRLLKCFPFEYFSPSSLIIASDAVHHKSDYVKSEALSLLDHWGNSEVLKFLKSHEPPTAPWLRMKYVSIMNSIEHHVAIQKV